MSDSLSEFLLQVQGGLMQGSTQAGIASPLGGVLLTSNIKESERLVNFWWNTTIPYVWWFIDLAKPDKA